MIRYRSAAQARAALLANHARSAHREEFDREVGSLTVPELLLPTMLPSDASSAPPLPASYARAAYHRRRQGRGSQSAYQFEARRLASFKLAARGLGYPLV